MVCEDFEFKISMCVDPMLWRVRTLRFQSSPVRELCAVACEDFSFFKVPLGVDSVLWCVRTV